MSSADQTAQVSRAIEGPDKRLDELHGIIARQSLLRGDFTLTSGRRSHYLFQLRQTTMHPRGAALTGQLIADFMQNHDLSCCGGLELGAVPVVAAVAAMSGAGRRSVQAFFVRKQPKAHGAGELIDGYLAEDGEILIVDDVTTSGGSILKTIAAIPEGKRRVRKALSIVDREEGAAQRLAGHGVALYALFKRRDFLSAG